MTPLQQARQLARDGYGWEDLMVMTGISEREARSLVWGNYTKIEAAE